MHRLKVFIYSMSHPFSFGFAHLANMVFHKSLFVLTFHWNSLLGKIEHLFPPPPPSLSLSLSLSVCTLEGPGAVIWRLVSVFTQLLVQSGAFVFSLTHLFSFQLNKSVQIYLKKLVQNITMYMTSKLKMCIIICNYTVFYIFPITITKNSHKYLQNLLKYMHVT